MVLAAIAATALLFVAQATLVSRAFTTPLQAGGLPAGLASLAAGPPPVTPAAIPGTASIGAIGAPLLPAPASSQGAEEPTAGQPRGPREAPSTAGASPLAGWSNALGAVTGVPPVALAAYGAAQVTLAETDPGCHLSWPTLAGIGQVESLHGRYDGAALGPDGRSTPPIIGIPLDGAPGVAEIRDTDGGQLDGDTAYDRAVGSMQFIPSTWVDWAADGDGDGLLDPFDVDDAAIAAARYLCAAGGDLATGVGWTRAVYAYNASDSYVISVRTTADEYAARSQRAAPR